MVEGETRVFQARLAYGVTYRLYVSQNNAFINIFLCYLFLFYLPIFTIS